MTKQDLRDEIARRGGNTRNTGWSEQQLKDHLKTLPPEPAPQPRGRRAAAEDADKKRNGEQPQEQPPAKKQKNGDSFFPTIGAIEYAGRTVALLEPRASPHAVRRVRFAACCAHRVRSPRAALTACAHRVLRSPRAVRSRVSSG